MHDEDFLVDYDDDSIEVDDTEACIAPPLVKKDVVCCAASEVSTSESCFTRSSSSSSSSFSGSSNSSSSSGSISESSDTASETSRCSRLTHKRESVRPVIEKPNVSFHLILSFFLFL